MTTPPPPKPRNLIQKILTLSAIGMGIGFGTCGLTVFTHAGDGRFWSNLALAGSIIFFVSFGVGVLTFLIFAAQQLWKTFRK